MVGTSCELLVANWVVGGAWWAAGGVWCIVGEGGWRAVGQGLISYYSTD